MWILLNGLLVFPTGSARQAHQQVGMGGFKAVHNGKNQRPTPRCVLLKGPSEGRPAQKSCLTGLEKGAFPRGAGWLEPCLCATRHEADRG